MAKSMKSFDIVIIGGGPAGISAGIYASRAGRKVLIVEKFALGGQLNLIGQIENYAGFKSIDGFSLAGNFAEHAKSAGCQSESDEIVSIKKTATGFTLKGAYASYKAKAVILAQGCHPRLLKIEGEEQFKGRGVSYCALCDGNFFRDKNVAVVGSGDSAFSDAIYLASICKKVYVLTKEVLKLHNYSEDELSDKKSVKILKGAVSKRILGQDKVEGLEYEMAGKTNKLSVDAVFVAIGRIPDTEMLKGLVELDTSGYVLADENMQTSLEGVFVCGDVRKGSLRQIATAVGEGAIAGTNASKYVLKSNAKRKIK